MGVSVNYSKCSFRYFVVIHELQTELCVFEAWVIANIGTWRILSYCTVQCTLLAREFGMMQL